MKRYEDGLHFVTTNTYQRKKIFTDERYCRILIDNIAVYRERMKFKLFGFVIMPDHVHLLIGWDREENLDLTISNIMRSIKSYSAKQILRDCLGQGTQTTQEGVQTTPGIQATQNLGRRGPLTSSRQATAADLGQGTQTTQEGVQATPKGPATLGNQATQNLGRRGPLTSSYYPDRRMSESKQQIWQAGFYDFNILSEQKFLEKLNYIHNNPVRAGLSDAPEKYKWSSARNYLSNDNSIMQIDHL